MEKILTGEKMIDPEEWRRYIYKLELDFTKWIVDDIIDGHIELDSFIDTHMKIHEAPLFCKIDTVRVVNPAIELSVIAYKEYIRFIVDYMTKVLRNELELAEVEFKRFDELDCYTKYKVVSDFYVADNDLRVTVTIGHYNTKTEEFKPYTTETFFLNCSIGSIESNEAYLKVRNALYQDEFH